MENKSVEGINAETFLKEKIKYGGWTKLNKLPFSLYEAVAIIMQEYTAQAVGDKQREIEGLKEEGNEYSRNLKNAIERCGKLTNDVYQIEKQRDHYKALHDALYKWQIEINDYDFNDRQGYEDAVVIAFNNYQSLKTQTP